MYGLWDLKLFSAYREVASRCLQVIARVTDSFFQYKEEQQDKVAMHKGKVRKSFYTGSTSKNPSCIYCSKAHLIYDCAKTYVFTLCLYLFLSVKFKLKI